MLHDDVIKREHFLRYWPFVRGIHRSLVNSPHKSQWRGALMFSLICTWMDGWVNNREAGDLRRHCAHYDVTVIENNIYVLERRTVSALTRVLFWCLFPELRSSEGNKHQNNTRVSTEAVRHESTYIILYLTRHKESINDDKHDDLYTSFPCLTCSVFVLLMTSQSIGDDVTMTWQLWRDHVNSDI